MWSLHASSSPESHSWSLAHIQFCFLLLQLSVWMVLSISMSSLLMEIATVRPLMSTWIYATMMTFECSFIPVVQAKACEAEALKSSVTEAATGVSFPLHLLPPYVPEGSLIFHNKFGSVGGSCREWEFCWQKTIIRYNAKVFRVLRWEMLKASCYKMEWILENSCNFSFLMPLFQKSVLTAA